MELFEDSYDYLEDDGDEFDEDLLDEIESIPETELKKIIQEFDEEDPEESKAHFELAYYWLSKANIEKHPAATLELAGFYRRGDVVEKDEVKSVALVKQAAELGDVQAMRDLAFIYENGMGVEANEEQADYWTQKADLLEEK